MPNARVPAAAGGLPTRRATLTTLALPAGAAALPPASDPIPGLYAESLRVAGILNASSYATEADADALMDQWEACEHGAIANRATTPAGAAVSLEWARAEFVQFYSEDRQGDRATSRKTAVRKS